MVGCNGRNGNGCFRTLKFRASFFYRGISVLREETLHREGLPADIPLIFLWLIRK